MSEDTTLRISSSSTPARGNLTGSISLANMSAEEVERFKSTLREGLYWVTTENGRLVFHPKHNPLPNPIDDEKMLPFWRPLREGEGTGETHEVTFIGSEKFDVSSPSFTIQHLCGYYYTPERYRSMASLLTTWGFDCLRSRRGDEGHYWEIWYLPGLWSAKGDLREAVGERPTGKDVVEKATRFLCAKASFGTLDVSVQRAAMTTSD